LFCLGEGSSSFLHHPMCAGHDGYLQLPGAYDHHCDNRHHPHHDNPPSGADPDRFPSASEAWSSWRRGASRRQSQPHRIWADTLSHFLTVTPKPILYRFHFFYLPGCDCRAPRAPARLFASVLALLPKPLPASSWYAETSREIRSQES
jgi:hypothetical protein